MCVCVCVCVCVCFYILVEKQKHAMRYVDEGHTGYTVELKKVEVLSNEITCGIIYIYIYI